MSKKEKINIREKDIKNPNIQNDGEQRDIEKARNAGKEEWVSENLSDESYRPIKDDLGNPPAGDDTE